MILFYIYMLFSYQNICTAFVLEIHARQSAVRKDILLLCWQKEEVVIREMETEQRIMIQKGDTTGAAILLLQTFNPRHVMWVLCVNK